MLKEYLTVREGPPGPPLMLVEKVDEAKYGELVEIGSWGRRRSGADACSRLKEPTLLCSFLRAQPVWSLRRPGSDFWGEVSN